MRFSARDDEASSIGTHTLRLYRIGTPTYVGGSNVTFGNDTISLNVAANGGGISASDGNLRRKLTINMCTVEGNTASDKNGGGGGIILNKPFFVTVTNSTINNNAANIDEGANGIGGGIYYPFGVVHDATYNIRNSTIYGNTAVLGGGVYIDLGSASNDLRLYNSTVAYNAATATDTKGAGGGIAFKDAASGDIVTLRSTIVTANTVGSKSTGPDIGDLDSTSLGIVVAAKSLILTSGSGFDATNVNSKTCVTTTSFAVFSTGSLGSNGGPTKTLALATTSDAINHGDNTLGLTYDQRGSGYNRVLGLYADIGAFELPVEEENG